MKATRGLAWIGTFLIATSAATEAREQRFDFPHLHQEIPSAEAFEADFSSCEFSVTGSFSGPNLPFLQTPAASSGNLWNPIDPL